MSGNKWLMSLIVPAALATSLGACTQTGGGTQPGIVNTSATGGYSSEAGRVISIREVPLGGGSGRPARTQDIANTARDRITTCPPPQR